MPKSILKPNRPTRLEFIQKRINFSDFFHWNACSSITSKLSHFKCQENSMPQRKRKDSSPNQQILGSALSSIFTFKGFSRKSGTPSCLFSCFPPKKWWKQAANWVTQERAGNTFFFMFYGRGKTQVGFQMDYCTLKTELLHSCYILCMFLW